MAASSTADTNGLTVIIVAVVIGVAWYGQTLLSPICRGRHSVTTASDQQVRFHSITRHGALQTGRFLSRVTTDPLLVRVIVKRKEKGGDLSANRRQTSQNSRQMYVNGAHFRGTAPVTAIF